MEHKNRQPEMEKTRLSQLYRSKSISKLPPAQIRIVADNCETKAQVNNDLLVTIFRVFKDRYGALASERRNNRQCIFENILIKLQERKLCRDTWCPLFRDHGFFHETKHCMSIGALQQLLMSFDLLEASKSIDEYFTNREMCRNPMQLCRNLFTRSSSRRDIQLLMDYNSLTNDNIRCLHRFMVEKGVVIKPFVIPKWEERFRNTSLSLKWANFVGRQVEQLSIKSIVVLKLCCGLDRSTDINVFGDEDDEENISSVQDAIRYVRHLISKNNRFWVDVKSPTLFDANENVEGENDEVDPGLFEQEIHYTRAKHHTDLSMYSFLEALLMCPYWARDRGYIS